MDISPITNKINLIVGGIGALLTYFLGSNWFLFAMFLGLNLLDFLTRWIAARLTGTENSHKGWTGILKKLCYWIMILTGFLMSVGFVKLGNVIGLDLGVTVLLGWFVLATLTVNEIRSILENLVDAGVSVPKFLTKGLEVANKVMDKVMEEPEAEE